MVMNDSRVSQEMVGGYLLALGIIRHLLFAERRRMLLFTDDKLDAQVGSEEAINQCLSDFISPRLLLPLKYLTKGQDD